MMSERPAIVLDETQAVDAIYKVRDGAGGLLATVRISGAAWKVMDERGRDLEDGLPFMGAFLKAQRYARTVLRRRGAVLDGDESLDAFRWAPLGLGEQHSEFACNHREAGFVGRIVHLADPDEWRAVGHAGDDLGVGSREDAEALVVEYGRAVVLVEMREEATCD
jgi:hypothetical protein